eukprot:750354-Hanusia_phi.AAC.4
MGRRGGGAKALAGSLDEESKKTDVEQKPAAKKEEVRRVKACLSRDSFWHRKLSRRKSNGEEGEGGVGEKGERTGGFRTERRRTRLR